MKEALGLLEVAGLAAAIKAADVMVKAANVTILNVEKARGGGWMTVKVTGDVGAVQAAVQAGVAQAKHERHYIAHKVIPRPAEGIDAMLLSGGGKPVLNPKATDVVKEETPAPAEKTEAKPVAATKVAAPAKAEAKTTASTAKPVKSTPAKASEAAKPAETAKTEPAKAATTAAVKAPAKTAEPVKPVETAKTEASKTNPTAITKAESSVDTAKEALMKVVTPTPKKRPSRAKTTTKPKA
ncbi:MAG: BMC domain-containing protein [Veillonella sp.]|uniref:BMC domain-containing protein n=1 Tax=Veillonella sp. TaxID=1926307 RepID=UPI0025E75D45|nr:BMC domain-containing protein [Veillonella sp.]MBE6079849.1 BMC domain-containing protein [Veillonella sp.]